jgi:hypothetical protein
MICSHMSDSTTPSETADHAAWAQAVRRRQVGVLEDLAQSGLRLAQGIESQALEAGAPAHAEAAMAFARVARAVRMTCLMQSRLIKDMDEALSRQAFERRCEAQRAEAAADEAREAVKDRVHAIVGRVACAQDGADTDRVERIADEASERLETDDIYGDVLARPMAELVADICRDLGLEPDWDQLGREAWAKAPQTPTVLARAAGKEQIHHQEHQAHQEDHQDGGDRRRRAVPFHALL